MKILFICEGITRYSIIAQPWKHVYELAKRTLKSGEEVKILTNRKETTPSEEEIGGVPVYRINSFLRGTEQLVRFLKNEDADIINWHGSDVWSIYYAWQLTKKVSVPIVWTLHSGILSLNDFKNLSLGEYLYLYKFWNNITNAIVSRFLARKWASSPILRGIITLSKRTATKLTKYGVASEKISTIPSGVDTKIFRPDHSENDYENLSILYFGQFSSFRGANVLLLSFKHVKRKIPAAKLVILAREKKEKKNRLLTKAMKENNVEVIMGVLAPQEVSKHLNNSKIVVLPFKFWPQVECPLTILEAMAVGKPVVTTSTGAIPEIVRNGETGILIPPNEPIVLANAIIKLLRNPLKCKEIGEKARSYVEQHHNWDKIVNETLKTLSAFLGHD